MPVFLALVLTINRFLKSGNIFLRVGAAFLLFLFATTLFADQLEIVTASLTCSSSDRVTVHDVSLLEDINTITLCGRVVSCAVLNFSDAVHQKCRIKDINKNESITYISNEVYAGEDPMGLFASSLNTLSESDYGELFIREVVILRMRGPQFLHAGNKYLLLALDPSVLQLN